MTEAATAAAEETKTAAKKKPAAKKAAAKKAAAGRATKVSAAGANAKKAATKKQAKTDKAISAGRKPPTEPKPKTLEGHTMDSKIKYGADADGKAYSQANCPARAGTGAEDQWRKYKDAKMTLQGAIDAGIPRTFVLHHVRQGWIAVA